MKLGRISELPWMRTSNYKAKLTGVKKKNQEEDEEERKQGREKSQGLIWFIAFSFFLEHLIKRG